MLRVLQSLRLGAASIARSPASLGLTTAQDSPHPGNANEASARAAHTAAQPAMDDRLEVAPVSRKKLHKSFQLHVGASLPVPTSQVRQEETPVVAQPLESSAAPHAYFEGLPLRAWAERLGERVMPTVELVQEEQRRVKAAASKLRAAAPELALPNVPSFLPVSRWVAGSKSMRNTLVADAADKRPKARLSWYHPDDSMVPRDWFKGGLLADLKYYRPFGNTA